MNCARAFRRATGSLTTASSLIPDRPQSAQIDDIIGPTVSKWKICWSSQDSPVCNACIALFGLVFEMRENGAMQPQGSIAWKCGSTFASCITSTHCLLPQASAARAIVTFREAGDNRERGGARSGGSNKSTGLARRYSFTSERSAHGRYQTIKRTEAHVLPAV